MTAQRVKRCKRRHTFTGAYCKQCKAVRERKRYWKNPVRERERKRSEYREEHRDAHIRVVREAISPMNEPTTTVEQECEHDLAKMTEAAGKKLYYCFDCDTWLDPVSMEPVPDPNGEPQAGKAPAPTHPQNGVGAPKQKSQPTKPRDSRPRRQERDETKMVLATCQHHDPKSGPCRNQWKVWPQNLNLVQFCPQLHRAQHKRELNKLRQAQFRQRHHSQQ